MTTDFEPSDRPARLDIGIIGAGRVGAVLGAALRSAGHQIVAVSAVSEASRERAAALLPGVPIRDIPDVIKDAHVVILAVPDDELEPLIRGLGAAGVFPRGQLVLHTSGRSGVEVFDGAPDVMPMAIHPAMTFTGTSIDLPRLQDCMFGVTAPDLVRPVAEALVIEMGGEPVWIAPEDRVAYHAGLAHGANHLVTLVSQAMQILDTAHVEQPDRVLRPLLEAALANALSSRDGALTGPVARGDAGTVARHIAALRERAPDVAPTYLALARATASRAITSGRLGARAAEPLLEILSHEETK